MALSTVIKNFTDGSLVIKDGTGTPLSLTVQFENGDFALSGLKANLRETVAYESRGRFKGVRHTTRTYPTGSFSAHFAEFSEDATGTLGDALLKQGTKWAAAVSTSGANAEVYTLDLTFTVEGTAHGDAADATFTLEDCECVLDYSEGDPSTFSVSFTCYGALTGDIAIALF